MEVNIVVFCNESELNASLTLLSGMALRDVAPLGVRMDEYLSGVVSFLGVLMEVKRVFFSSIGQSDPFLPGVRMEERRVALSLSSSELFPFRKLLVLGVKRLLPCL